MESQRFRDYARADIITFSENRCINYLSIPNAKDGRIQVETERREHLQIMENANNNSR